MSEENTVIVITTPKYKSMLTIGGKQGLRICGEQNWPNAWHRFWQRFFLGFKWEQIDE